MDQILRHVRGGHGPRAGRKGKGHMMAMGGFEDDMGGYDDMSAAALGKADLDRMDSYLDFEDDFDRTDLK